MWLIPSQGPAVQIPLCSGCLGLEDNISIYRLFRWLQFNLDWSSQFWENWHFTYGPLYGIYWSPEDTTYTEKFREMVSINYWYLIKIIRAVFENITIFFYEAHLKGPNFFKLQCSYSLRCWHDALKYQIWIESNCYSANIHIYRWYPQKLFVFREAKNAQIQQNLGTDFFHNHNTLPYYIHEKVKMYQWEGLYS